MTRATAVLAAAWIACAAAAGCSRPAPDGPITADQLPHVKVGAWQVVSSESGSPPTTASECSDGKLSFGSGFLPQNCSPPSMKRVSGTYVLDIQCPASSGPVRSNLHAVAAGDFQSAYRVDMQDLFGDSHKSFKYLGPCPEGAPAS